MDIMEQRFAISDPNTVEILKDLVTARIDIKNEGDNENDIKTLEMSDKNAVETTPVWFKDDRGQGHVIISTSGQLSIKFRCIKAGVLCVYLHAIDVRNAENKRIPLYVYYKRFAVNGETVFDSVRSVWHDSPCVFIKAVSDGETVTLYAEWVDDIKTAVLLGNNEIEKLSADLKGQKELVAQEQWYIREIKLKLKKEKTVKLNELNAIKSGMSFKIGRIITYIPRKLLGRD